MSRRWENQEVPGRGTKFCLVIDPEDGTHPIKTYGWSELEVLDKVAKTAETAQQVINRQRAVSTVPTPAASPVRPLTADEQMQATTDLSNPAKAPEAVKTLLRGAGFDVDRQRLLDDAGRVGAIAQEWERNHPEFPHDERNQRLLMDKALLKAGSLGAITAEVFDAAFAELSRHNMLFDVAPPSDPNDEPAPPNAPDGNPAPRIERPRTATSYNRTALRAPITPVADRKPRYSRAEIDAMNSKQLREKIDHEPGFADWYNREFSAAAT